MKTKNLLLTLALVLISSMTLAQVGIGTVTPGTTLEIKGNATSTTTADGVQVPALSLAHLDAKVAAYGTDQDGAIIYVNDVTGGSTQTETAAITTTGFYYYDASSNTWKVVGGSTSSGSTLAIGDSYQGGKIFWLDATGQHGLIAATADQSTGIQWWNGDIRYTGTTGDGLYAGSTNTAMIVATQMADNQTGNFAAKVCADYSVTVGVVTYGDWYLPSKYELNLLYLQKTVVGGFANSNYWSSSEYSNNYAWLQYFANGSQGSNFKGLTYYVRAVRAF